MSTSNNSLSEAEKFLESLNLQDSSSNQDSTDATNTEPATTAPSDRNDIMSFLDEISNYPNEDKKQQEASLNNKNSNNSTTTTTTTTTIAATNSAATAATAANVPAATDTLSEQTMDRNGGGDGGWMSWGNSLLAQASHAVKTTTDQINRTVQSTDSKNLLEERVKHLQTLVNKDTIEKLGTNLRQLTTHIMETVAPPISEHELVEVWLSHDGAGYQGMEALVYRAFARVMEQTQSGEVIVRKGMEDGRDEEATRDLNMCEGVVEGTKLAKANVDRLIKLQHLQPETTTTIPHGDDMPVINCPVYMAIQPARNSFTDDYTVPSQFVYIIVLEDPTNKLSFQTYSQSIPLAWMDIPYEENEWVEDKIVDVLRMAVTTVAQDYVYTRMTGYTKLAQAVEESSKQQDQQSQEQKPSTEAKSSV